MKKNLTLVALMLASSRAWALPGFVEAVKRYRPDLAPKCTTCHNLTLGRLPDDTNVRKEGLVLYKELLKQDRNWGRSIASLPEKINKPDFIVFGDNRTHPDVHQDIVNQICALAPKAVFQTGDIVASGGSKSQWQEALQIEKCLVQAKILYPTCGNHEGSGCLDNVLRKAIGNTKKFYTVDVEGFTFIALDSYDPTQEQLDWLSSLPPGKNYIPFYHYVPYPTIAGHGADNYVLKNFIPRFKALGVKVAFNGHNHGYDRAVVDGITYVTSGGGGAPLYPCGADQSYTKACLSEHHFVKCAVQGSQITCEAKTRDGKIFDTFSANY